MSQAQPSLTRGVHHVGLTVPTLAETRAFFIDLLGFEQVGEKPDYPAVFISDGQVMLTLWQAEAGARGFDRRGCVGLHHLALAVDDHAALDEVHRTIAGSPGVEIEFPPEALGAGPAKHMMCTIPGGLRLEFFSAKD